MATLTITKNSVQIPLPEPESLSIAIQDLDSEKTGRNQKGNTFRDRIAVKRKITCTFLPMTDDEMKTVLQATSEKFFDITYPDPMTGANRQMTAYVGDRTSPIMRIKNGRTTWDTMTVNIVER